MPFEMECFRQSLDKSPNLVTNSSVAVALLFFAGSSGSKILGYRWWIAETDMEHFFCPWEKRTSLAGIIANGYYCIENDIPEAVEMFRCVPGDIHTGLGHYLYRCLI